MAENKNLALAIVGLAGFQMLTVWHQFAPSLSELREASPSDTLTRQKLLDADIMVGSTVLILGTAITILTDDKTPLIIMATLFSTVAVWHHLVQSTEGAEDYGFSG